MKIQIQTANAKKTKQRPQTAHITLTPTFKLTDTRHHTPRTRYDTLTKYAKAHLTDKEAIPKLKLRQPFKIIQQRPQTAIKHKENKSRSSLSLNSQRQNIILTDQLELLNTRRWTTRNPLPSTSFLGRNEITNVRAFRSKLNDHATRQQQRFDSKYEQIHQLFQNNQQLHRPQSQLWYSCRNRSWLRCGCLSLCVDLLNMHHLIVL
eukprot:870742_1